ncbi:MAG: DsbA family protein [Candidatus Sungiibacteriota bacterium]|uniref:DsbA family protein n=1 Tax=Candidatus Sungiibacteriota bacterium TaxID=2750080 RepID=A0A7T5URZ6_9BACT|nr:MAG: DsbA family protein [Candidatus Sungbacteria bacterium]
MEEDTKIETEDIKNAGAHSAPNPYLVPAAIVIAGLLIAGAVFYTNSPKTPAANRQTAAAGEPAISATGDLADDDPVLGNPEALVTVIEFSDFQCPFCRRFFRDTLSQLKDKYIKTGKVRFVYRDFPLTGIHDMAQKYAEAAECADEQGKFWQMHDKIFEEQDKRGVATVFDITVADIKQWARGVGLNGAAFDGCLDSDKYFEEVQKDFRDGQANGVNGTPGTFVNGRLIQGAVPFEQFASVIEQELGRAK